MADWDFLWPFLMLLLRSDSREMTGKHCVERRGSGSGKKNTRWDSNSGHCERSYAECRHTNYKAIGAEAHGDFCAEITSTSSVDSSWSVCCTGYMCVDTHWNEGGLECPMPPVLSSGGGSSVWMSVHTDIPSVWELSANTSYKQTQKCML